MQRTKGLVAVVLMLAGCGGGSPASPDSGPGIPNPGRDAPTQPDQPLGPDAHMPPAEAGQPDSLVQAYSETGVPQQESGQMPDAGLPDTNTPSDVVSSSPDTNQTPETRNLPDAGLPDYPPKEVLVSPADTGTPDASQTLEAGQTDSSGTTTVTSTSTSTGTSTGTTTSTTTTTSTATSTTTGTDACAPVPNNAPWVWHNQVAAPVPTFTGGTWPEGTYYETDLTIYTGVGGAAGPDGDGERATVVIKGNTSTLIVTTNGAPDRTGVSAMTFVVSGNQSIVTPICGGSTARATPFTASGDTITMLIESNRVMTIKLQTPGTAAPTSTVTL
jgi:hypothetical protein